jgi:hypothetical protein
LSFNSYARKVRNVNLPLDIRASALLSCMLTGGLDEGHYSFQAMVGHLGRLVGADLFHSAEESHLLAALHRMEVFRNLALDIRRAFERKRIRQKCRGRRFPCKAEQLALSEAITAIRKASDLLPDQNVNSVALS